MNSPWDPISTGSSRRSSLVTGGGHTNTNTETSAAGPAISQHLGRLRKKAQTVQQEQQLQSLTPNAAQSENLRNMSGRTSAMSDVSLVAASATQLHNTHLQQMQNMQPTYSNNPNQAIPKAQQQQWNTNLQYPQAQYQQTQQNGQGPRRASDPVRALDRNFGVTPAHNHPQAQLNNSNKSGSFQNVNNSQMNQRVPLHGQRIRGVSGDSHQVNQQMHSNGMPNQVSFFLLQKK